MIQKVWVPKEISHIPGEEKSEIVFDFLESLEVRTTVDNSKHEITRDLDFLLHKQTVGKFTSKKFSLSHVGLRFLPVHVSLSHLFRFQFSCKRQNNTS